jgi:type III secretion protein L
MAHPQKDHMADHSADHALPAGPGLRILRAADAEAWQDGFQFRSKARRYAIDIVEQARRGCDTERARGYAEGRAQGTLEATRLIAETTLAVDRYLASLEGEAARVAIAIVSRLLGEFDAADLVARIATKAIAEFRREKWLKITVHPAVVESVRGAIHQVDGELGCLVTVESDPKLAPGSCVVASEFAVIDAGVSAQLTAIAAAFGIKQTGRGA